jgi:hypothetical protein
MGTVDPGCGADGSDRGVEPEAERPKCTSCDKPLWARGEQTQLRANEWRGSGQAGAHLWQLPDLRSRFFSRLYEQLGLLSGGLTLRGEEMLVRLASWMPICPSAGVAPGDIGDPSVQGDSAASDAAGRGSCAVGVRENEVAWLKQEVP